MCVPLKSICLYLLLSQKLVSSLLYKQVIHFYHALSWHFSRLERIWTNKQWELWSLNKRNGNTLWSIERMSGSKFLPWRRIKILSPEQFQPAWGCCFSKSNSQAQIVNMTGARHRQYRRADRASAPLNPKPVYSSFAKPWSLHSSHVIAQLKRSYQ